MTGRRAAYHDASIVVGMREREGESVGVRGRRLRKDEYLLLIVMLLTETINWFFK
jgi:hypothetical protein